MKSAAVILLALLMVGFTVNVVVVEGTMFTSRHCKWHGTAPMCMGSCPSSKVSKMESKCGNNKLVCCITGTKKLCCPKEMDITPEMAAAIAE
ncbi:hypothetical protein BV898_09192 [Hypsibius exemplaris]|uniref:Beta-defensin n=1 Tax=Hypsibius exemplaris TaxID=2072580 RepID=A0A1W0WN89_HYPEX|nr:hypothetical protein BV898_09192 [Hypsibius exemplaris]